MSFELVHTKSPASSGIAVPTRSCRTKRQAYRNRWRNRHSGVSVLRIGDLKDSCRYSAANDKFSRPAALRLTISM
jgi:hypothetical protein